MATCRHRVLYQGPLASVRDSECWEPRSPGTPEELARSHHLVFTRRGVFVKLQGRRRVVAEPTRVLLFNEGEPYRMSHPVDGGDDCTVLEFPAHVVADVAARHDPAAADREERPFAHAHAPATPALLLRTHLLRLRLHGGAFGALVAEEEAIGVLDDVLGLAHAAHDAPTPRLRPSTRRARRELVEATRVALARDPRADVSLAALAREVAASPFHLARTFRAATGVPVHQYLLQLRAALALERLADDDVSLGMLALELGFASHSHFTTAFRRVVGTTPSAVRERLSGARLRELRKNVEAPLALAR